MKIFLDTAEIEEIRIAHRWGVLDGVTTNPSLYAKVGGSYEDILREICRITPGPVSAEVVAEDVEGMLREGRAFAKLARNIVVKVPMSEEGLEAISRFAEEGIKTNCTLIFSSNQGLLAAKAGASLISPFIGRLDDINQDGMIVIRELVEIFELHNIDAEILTASVRNPLHVTQAALAGSHIATLPFKILQQMVHHPLTDKGIVTFRQDWEKARAASAAKSGAGAPKAGAASTPKSGAASSAKSGAAAAKVAPASTARSNSGNGSKPARSTARPAKADRPASGRSTSGGKRGSAS